MAPIPATTIKNSSMRKICMIMIILATGLASAAQAQNPMWKSIEDVNVMATLPNGFSIEAGKLGTAPTRPLGWYVGLTSEFGPRAQKDFDLTLYAKGQYYICRYIHATAMAGIVDFSRLTLGLGAKGIIPINGNVDILVEPLWRFDDMRVNAGLRYKL
jgi:hypothetical protein